jgi:hypothetical protein
MVPVTAGRVRNLTLRRAEIDARFPGLLAAVLTDTAGR